MAAKRCRAGHQGCACGMVCCALDPAIASGIAADARSGTNWASQVGYGAACTCGAGERLFQAALALRGKHGVPTRECTRHPGGTVARKPGGTRYPGENGN